MLEKKTYDLVLMDIEMPLMDGMEATIEIRRRWGDDGPRIVAVTANALRGDRDRYLAVGMDDYISKPIRIEALLEVLQGYSNTPDEEGSNQANRPMLLDPSAITALKAQIGDNRADLALLIESFLELGPGLCRTLSQAAQDGDWKTLYRTAHTLKTSARDFGATELADFSAALEEQARAEDAAMAMPMAAQLTQSYQQAETALRAFLQSAAFENEHP
jgi:CheY-like chemotaxis protein